MLFGLSISILNLAVWLGMVVGLVILLRKRSPMLKLIVLGIFSFLGYLGCLGWSAIQEAKKDNVRNNISGGNEDCQQLDRDYLVRDEKVWTYKLEEGWKWNDDFKELFKCRTGWSYSKNGNYTFKLIHRPRNLEEEKDQAQSFVSGGGAIEIEVNGDACCCTGNLFIPAGTRGRNIDILKNNLQNEIDLLLLKEQDAVIRGIADCLK